MKRVFADTAFWIAIFVPGDGSAAPARAFDCSDALIVTTEEVLGEFLTAISAHGDHSRRLACELVRGILSDPEIEVVAQSHESFLAGLAFYERRPDKQYSLADCISMNVMCQGALTRSSPVTTTSRKRDLGAFSNETLECLPKVVAVAGRI